MVPIWPRSVFDRSHDVVQPKICESMHSIKLPVLWNLLLHKRFREASLQLEEAKCQELWLQPHCGIPVQDSCFLFLAERDSCSFQKSALTVSKSFALARK